MYIAQIEMIILVAPIVILLLFAPDLFAWGFETHINIGLNIIETTSIQFIKNFPAHFLLGNIFPDFFNLFKNFSSLKKSLNTHSWQTVSHLFSNAKNDEEKSFAHGYAAHLSADIIAHNNFIPNYFLLKSNKKVFAHFLTETAEESFNNKKFRSSLYYLLDNAAELGEAFLRVKNIDRNYFKKQIKYIKFGLFYQYTLNVGKISQNIRKKSNPDFEKECIKYQDDALNYAKEAVENGFSKFVKYDPNGTLKMKKAKEMRKKLIVNLGKKGVNGLKPKL